MMLHFFLCLFTIFPFTLMAMGTLEERSISRAMNNATKPLCPSKCGNVTILYPFGIGNDCSLDETFNVTCNNTYKPPKLFLGSSNIEIYNISDLELRIATRVAFRCYAGDGSVYDDSNGWTRLSAFTFSKKNKFIVIGCDDYGLISGEEGDEFSSGCIGLCSEAVDVVDGQCTGKGCCQTSISKALQFTNYTLNSFRNHSSVWSINQCGYAFLAEEGSFQFRGADDISSKALDVWNRIMLSVPVVVDWVIARDRNCSTAMECKENSSCYDVEGGGYRCKCKDGYKGNPYLDTGCQDIDECTDKSDIRCYGHTCINTAGGYNCSCSPGYKGDAYKLDGCQPIAKAANFPVMVFTLALVFCLVALLSVVSGTFFGVRKRKLIKLREKFFEQNGGAFLKQKLKAPGTSDVIIYSIEELQKATNNYSKERIIGQGSYGVVYKGILSDKREVAIKKSKLVDGTQAEQFINEVLIHTQVIHRNVVKVLGCCLEEEVPILVYEFISNNTLFYHIHHKLGGMSWLSWENRLRVASEAAGALGYLHSQATMPIIHRDVKSSNILLDDNYTTKISDFGASRLVPLDHDQVTTLVQGTLGYLDPEYFHTSQLTDKSDVYSFGVVLAELITGQKPLSADRTNEEKNLATYFVKAMKEFRLFEIVEPRILREGTLEQLQAVGDLVKRCLNLHGNDRPTMKEVAMELEGMKKITTHPWDKQKTHEESTILTLEVEQTDLYDVPLIPYSTGEWDYNSYSVSSTSMSIQENQPR